MAAQVIYQIPDIEQQIEGAPAEDNFKFRAQGAQNKPLSVKLVDKANQGAKIRLEIGDHGSILIDHGKANVRHTVTGSRTTLEMDQVVQVKYRAYEHKLKQEIILLDRPASNQFTEYVTLTGLQIVDHNGRWVYEKNGVEVAHIPPLVVRDFAGRETLADLEVERLAGANYRYTITVSQEWLNEAEYPVVIDPTTVVASAYTTAGNNGRKIVELSNGWLVAGVSDGSGSIYFYKSEDAGQTWAQLCYVSSGTGYTPAMCSNGTTVYVALYKSGYKSLTFDAITVTNADQTANLVTISTDVLGNSAAPSICIDGNGYLHVTWQGTFTGYPNSSNIGYSKSTNDGASWAARTLITTVNTSGSDLTKPCIVVTSSDLPFIVSQYVDSPTYKSINAYKFNGAIWASAGQPHYGGSYEQASPCAVVDSNGHIHVVWAGTDASSSGFYEIKYSKTTDDGSNWSAAVDLTANKHQDPTISVDGNDRLYVLCGGIDSGVSATYQNIIKIVYDGSWGSPVTLTSNTTNSASNPAALMDSVNYVGWIYKDDQAGAVKFDYISLNSAPYAPVDLARSNYDATADGDFTWTFSDPNVGDTQSAYQLLILQVSDGSTVVDTGKVASGTASYTVAAGTLTNNTQYQWTVRTYDQADVVGDYSNLATFWCSAKPTVTITFPALDGDTITTSSLTAQWSVSDPESEGQSAYQVKLTDNADTLLWDSTKKTSAAARSRTIGVDLDDATDYKVKITAWDAKVIQSAEVVRTFSTSFTLPQQPTIEVINSNSGGYISVAITNPEPGVGEPSILSNDIYRREQGTTAWTRIATDIPDSGSYDDYAAASGIAYEYKVRANGDNSTSIDSETDNATLPLRGVWLHDVLDPGGTAHQFKYDGGGRNEQWEAEGAMLQFAGRTKPVMEFGEGEAERISAQLQMISGETDYAALKSLVARKGTLCFRDKRGRKMFGVIPKLPIADERNDYKTTIEVIATAYTEAV